ncbi:MAG: C40 family peptidase, partial [Emergencia sp.]
DKDVLESKVIKSAQKKIVLVGTKEETPAATSYSGGSASYSGTVYSGSGSAIANYALQFVGNPYVYGGSSLTNGADCSGFVYSVYRNCGYSVPRTGQGGCGRSVSLSAAKAGDIIIYPGHVSIYIGGGQEVHAVNEGMGIAVTSVGYTGSVLDVRRVVE